MSEEGEPTREAVSSKEVRDMRLLFMRTAVQKGLGVLKSVLLGRLLAPRSMALWQLGAQWLGYARNLNFGWAAFGFLTPGALAAGDDPLVQRLRRVGGWGAIVGGALSLVAVGAAVVVTTSDWHLTAAFAMQAATLLAFRVSLESLRVRQEFSRLARIEVVHPVVGLAVGVTGLLLAGLAGFIWGAVCAQIYVIISCHGVAWRGLSRPSGAEVREATVFGAKIFVTNLLGSFFETVPYQVLAYFFVGVDDGAVGQYAFAAMLATLATSAMDAVITVQAVRNLADLRKVAEDDPDTFLASTYRYSGTDVLLAAVVASLGIAVAQPLVPLAFPKYAGVTMVLPGLLYWMVARRLVRYHTAILKTRERNGALWAVYTGGIILAGGLVAGAVKLSMPLWCIALVPAASSLVIAPVVMQQASRCLDARASWLPPFSRTMLFALLQAPIVACVFVPRIFAPLVGLGGVAFAFTYWRIVDKTVAERAVGIIAVWRRKS